MAYKATFSCYTHNFVRNEYRTSSDSHKLSEEELKEVLSYKNISEEFPYRNWFDYTTKVVATLVNVEQSKSGSLLFHIEVNKDIPEHYIPDPYQILKGKGLLFPISYSQI